jgi:two-component system chemotaxis response regulator CheB
VASTCRVLIVERGGTVSRLMRPLFTGRIAEAGSAVDYGGLVEAANRSRPQLVLLDLQGNAREALAALEALMGQCPTPVLLVTGPGTKLDAARALAAGALEVVELPEHATPEFFKALTAQVLLLSKVSVLRHVKGRKRPEPASAIKAPFPLVAIASSLGGPKALARVLADLPKSFGAAVVICQHITAGFADDLSRWLQSETRRDVVEVTEAMPLTPGRIFVAGSDAHLLARLDFTLGVEASAPVGGPSCDVLLRSVAASFRDRAIGVVLTGMGRDGARGLKEIRARGGHTIAQDEASSVVFGMPGEAIALGAAEKTLPLDQIGAQLGRWV